MPELTYSSFIWESKREENESQLRHLNFPSSRFATFSVRVTPLEGTVGVSFGIFLVFVR